MKQAAVQDYVQITRPCLFNFDRKYRKMLRVVVESIYKNESSWVGKTNVVEAASGRRGAKAR